MSKNNEFYNEKPTESFQDSGSDVAAREKNLDGPRPAGTGPTHGAVGGASSNKNAILANPLAGVPRETLMNDAATFAHAHGLGHLEKEFIKGALIAQDPVAFENLDILSEEEKEVFRREITHRWSQPKDLYLCVVLIFFRSYAANVNKCSLCIMCAVAAAVQGMDETVINGAQLFFAPQFGIDTLTGPNTGQHQWLLGLVNSAPYVSLLWSSVRIFIHIAYSYAALFWDAGSLIH